MKRRSHPVARSSRGSCYKRSNKRPFDYSAMYGRNPHLRPPLSGKIGAYAPHVANPFWREPNVLDLGTERMLTRAKPGHGMRAAA